MNTYTAPYATQPCARAKTFGASSPSVPLSISSKPQYRTRGKLRPSLIASVVHPLLPSLTASASAENPITVPVINCFTRAAKCVCVCVHICLHVHKHAHARAHTHTQSASSVCWFFSLSLTPPPPPCLPIRPPLHVKERCRALDLKAADNVVLYCKRRLGRPELGACSHTYTKITRKSWLQWARRTALQASSMDSRRRRRSTSRPTRPPRCTGPGRASQKNQGRGIRP